MEKPSGRGKLFVSLPKTMFLTSSTVNGTSNSSPSLDEMGHHSMPCTNGLGITTWLSKSKKPDETSLSIWVRSSLALIKGPIQILFLLPLAIGWKKAKLQSSFIHFNFIFWHQLVFSLLITLAYLLLLNWCLVDLIQKINRCRVASPLLSFPLSRL